MTAAGLGFDLAAAAVVVGMALLERRRGGARALLSFAAMVLALVVFPSAGPPLAAPFGGGVLALAFAASALLLAALAVAWWVGRRLAAARVKKARAARARSSAKQVDVDDDDADEVGSHRVSSVVGATVGLIEGVILVGSLSLALVYLELARPDLAPLTRGSFLVQLTAEHEASLRLWLFDTDEPVTPANGTRVPAPETRPVDGPAAAGDGALDRMKALAELLSVQAIMDDPELMRAIERENYMVLLGHPKLVELWQDPSFRRYIATVDTRQLLADKQKMDECAVAYEEAFTAYAAGDHPRALAAAGRVALLAPDFGRVLILKGQILAAMANAEGATAAWQEAAKAYPEAAEPLHLLGVQAGDAGKPEAAIELYGQALARDPEFSYAAHNRGVLRFQAGQFLDAVADLRQALAARPDDPDLRSTFADALGRLFSESRKLMMQLHDQPEHWPRLLEWHRDFAERAGDEVIPQMALAGVYKLGVWDHGLVEHSAAALTQLDHALEVGRRKQLESGDPASRTHQTGIDLLTGWRCLVSSRVDPAEEALAPAAALLTGGTLPTSDAADLLLELGRFAHGQGRVEDGRRLAAVAAGILRGTPGEERVRQRWRLLDPEDLPSRDLCDELVGGQILTVRKLGSGVTYGGAAVSTEPAVLQPGDVVVAIDGVVPLWPDDLQMLGAAGGEPVVLQVKRGEEDVTVSVESGLDRVVWDVRRPFRLSAGLVPAAPQEK